jgi:hypothetical protein
MKRVIMAAAVVAVGLAGTWSDCLAVAGAGGIVLEFPIGARYNAMGEAGVALAQDATATWWNPGGLAFMGERNKPRDFQIMQSNLAAGLADDIRLYWAGYAAPMASGTLGINQRVGRHPGHVQVLHVRLRRGVRNEAHRQPWRGDRRQVLP